MLQEDYTTKVLGLQEASITDVKETEEIIEIYVQQRRRKHRCPACGCMTDTVHDYRWQRVKRCTATHEGHRCPVEKASVSLPMRETFCRTIQ